jgi:hypothetical protein
MSDPSLVYLCSKMCNVCKLPSHIAPFRDLLQTSAQAFRRTCTISLGSARGQTTACNKADAAHHETLEMFGLAPACIKILAALRSPISAAILRAVPVWSAPHVALMHAPQSMSFCINECLPCPVAIMSAVSVSEDPRAFGLAP